MKRIAEQIKQAMNALTYAHSGEMLTRLDKGRVLSGMADDTDDMSTKTGSGVNAEDIAR